MGLLHLFGHWGTGSRHDFLGDSSSAVCATFPHKQYVFTCDRILLIQHFFKKPIGSPLEAKDKAGT